MSFDFVLVRFGETKKYRDNATVCCSYKISVQSILQWKENKRMNHFNIKLYPIKEVCSL